jgi:DNA polymerase-3 subunit epsilon
VKPLAFIAVRTTGPDPDQDDIVELAAIRVDARTLEVEDALALAVLPDHVGRAVSDTEPTHTFLAHAVERLEPVVRGTMLAGHDLPTTLEFVRRAWRAHGHEPDDIDELRFDIGSIAWVLVGAEEPEELEPEIVCERLGIVGVKPDSALGLARYALELVRRAVAAYEQGRARSAQTAAAGAC